MEIDDAPELELWASVLRRCLLDAETDTPEGIDARDFCGTSNAWSPSVKCWGSLPRGCNHNSSHSLTIGLLLPLPRLRFW